MITGPFTPTAPLWTCAALALPPVNPSNTMFKNNWLVVELYVPLNTPLAVEALAGTEFAPLSNPEKATVVQVADAVRVRLLPAQIVVGPGGMMLTTGFGFTVSVAPVLEALVQVGLL